MTYSILSILNEVYNSCFDKLVTLSLDDSLEIPKEGREAEWTSEREKVSALTELIKEYELSVQKMQIMSSLLSRATQVLKNAGGSNAYSIINEISLIAPDSSQLVMSQTFGEFLQSIDGEIDVCSDYEDTDGSTVVWNSSKDAVTMYGYEKYRKALDSHIISYKDGILFLDCPAKAIEQLTNAMAGYISDDEYNRCFRAPDSAQRVLSAYTKR